MWNFRTGSEGAGLCEIKMYDQSQLLMRQAKYV